MKTTKRSKMLLSSIAMLLVALVALGSATYAWYTLNRIVTADSLTVNASTPKGLVIAQNTGNDTTDLSAWGTEIKLIGTSAATETLVPTSLILPAAADEVITTNGAATGNKYDAAAANAYAKTGSATAATAGTDYLTGTFEVFKSGSSDVVATLAATATADTDTYVNFVVYDVTEDKVVAVSSNAAGMNGYINASGNEVDFSSEIYASAGDAKQFVGASDSDAGIHFDATNGVMHQYRWYAYVDGQNTKCTTNDAKTTGIALSVTVTATSGI